MNVDKVTAYLQKNKIGYSVIGGVCPKGYNCSMSDPDMSYTGSDCCLKCEDNVTIDCPLSQSMVTLGIV